MGFKFKSKNQYFYFLGLNNCCQFLLQSKYYICWKHQWSNLINLRFQIGYYKPLCSQEKNIFSIIYNKIISCSEDQTIKISDMKMVCIIKSINYICSCFSGLDYSESQDFIIAPNDTFVSVWSSDSGIQRIKSEHLYEREQIQFIQLILSKDSRKAIISLFNIDKILILKIDLLNQKILISNTIKTLRHPYNIQFGLGDKTVFYIANGDYILFDIDKLKLPVIGIRASESDMPFMNTQVNSLNYLISFCGYQVFVSKRQKNDPQQYRFDL